MSASVEGGNEADPNLVPLLDVVLQLIMFFMITVNFVRTDYINEDIDLPIAQSAVVLEESPDYKIFMNLNDQGKLVGAELEDLDTPGKITAHLRERKLQIEREARELDPNMTPKIVVILRADKDSRYAQVWNVLHTCTEAGFEYWQLRVLTGGTEGA